MPPKTSRRGTSYLTLYASLPYVIFGTVGIVMYLLFISRSHQPQPPLATIKTKKGATYAFPDATPGNPTAVLHTTHGDVTFTLLPLAAPLTVSNFVHHAETGFFNGTSFYRAEPGFCLQGGGWGRKDGVVKAKVPLEYNPLYPNKMRFVSMARTSEPNTADTEFSIMLGDNAKWLGPGGSDAYGYAVFAEVTGGWNVVEAMAKLPGAKSGGLTYLAEPRPVIRYVSIHT